MLESDADRLASIKGLGGQLISAGDGSVWALFDAVGVQQDIADTHVNSDAPRLTMRSVDVMAYGLNKRGITVRVVVDELGTEAEFTTREHIKGDAPGWSVVILDSV